MEIYLDNSATTRVCTAACNAAVSAMRDCYGNPSSLHHMGFQAEKLMDTARSQIARALGCLEEELVFTSGATESNNLAVTGLTAAYPRAGKKIVTTAIEHPSVLEPCRRMEEAGYTVVRLPLDENGQITPEAFGAAVDTDTALVSFMLVNNEVGTLLDAQRICRIIKQKSPGTMIHIDAVQGFCKVPFRLKQVLADTVSISGHKIYAPKGIGALYIRKGVRIRPLVVGGGQERNLRSGTESVPLAAAFGAAVAETYPRLEQHLAWYRELRAGLLEQLAEIPEAVIHSSPEGVPYIVNFSVRGIRSEIMLHHLEKDGIYVSSGSACAKGAQSHVLQALGLPRADIDTAIRVSFSPETDKTQIDALVLGIKKGLATLARQGR